MRRAERLERSGALDRVGQQRVERDVGVGDLVDERGVGAVLQQAAHQIGQQGLVRADRRIDAAGPVELRPARRLPRRAARPCRAGTGTRTGRRRNCRRPWRGSWPASAHCGWRTAGTPRRARPAACGRRRGRRRRCGCLPREDREVFQAVDLRALDLAVPVGALDQPHHQPPAGCGGRDRSASRSRSARASDRPGRRSRCRSSPPARARSKAAPAGRARVSSRSASSASMLRPIS